MIIAVILNFLLKSDLVTWSVRVQRYATYHKYRETAVQDTYRDTKNDSRYVSWLLYYTLTFDGKLQNLQK